LIGESWDGPSPWQWNRSREIPLMRGDGGRRSLLLLLEVERDIVIGRLVMAYHSDGRSSAASSIDDRLQLAVLGQEGPRHASTTSWSGSSGTPTYCPRVVPTNRKHRDISQSQTG